MKIYSIQVRRDANTITPTEVAEHEVAILQTMFGPENVHNANGKRIDENPLTDADVAGEVELELASEHDRLAAKYGANDEGVVVEQVFGKKASKQLESAIAFNESNKAGKADVKADAKAAKK